MTFNQPCSLARAVTRARRVAVLGCSLIGRYARALGRQRTNFSILPTLLFFPLAYTICSVGCSHREVPYHIVCWLLRIFERNGTEPESPGSVCVMHRFICASCTSLSRLAQAEECCRSRDIIIRQDRQEERTNCGRSGVW